LWYSSSRLPKLVEEVSEEEIKKIVEKLEKAAEEDKYVFAKNLDELKEKLLVKEEQGYPVLADLEKDGVTFHGVTWVNYDPSSKRVEIAIEPKGLWVGMSPEHGKYKHYGLSVFIENVENFTVQGTGTIGWFTGDHYRGVGVNFHTGDFPSYSCRVRKAIGKDAFEVYCWKTPPEKYMDIFADAILKERERHDTPSLKYAYTPEYQYLREHFIGFEHYVRGMAKGNPLKKAEIIKKITKILGATA